MFCTQHKLTTLEGTSSAQWLVRELWTGGGTWPICTLSPVISAKWKFKSPGLGPLPNTPTPPSLYALVCQTCSPTSWSYSPPSGDLLTVWLVFIQTAERVTATGPMMQSENLELSGSLGCPVANWTHDEHANAQTWCYGQTNPIIEHHHPGPPGLSTWPLKPPSRRSSSTSLSVCKLAKSF